MSNNIFTEKFTIKYEIKTFEELKLPNRIKTLVQGKAETIYRMIFYGTSGLGKTTLSKILSKNHDILYLSGSNDFNIDKMRNKIYPFCNQFSVKDLPKIVIIDECERIPLKLQDAFKIVLDSTKNTTKFIFITNDYTKIIDAIKSRSTSINFNYTADELAEQQGYFVQYAVDICQKENISFDRDGMMALYKKIFPDFRQLLETLETFKLSNEKITEASVNKSEIIAGKQNMEIYDLIGKPQNYTPKQFYQIISKYKGKEEDVFNSLCEPYFAYLNGLDKYDKTLASAEIINKYCCEYHTTMNKFALLISCVHELRKIGI